MDRGFAGQTPETAFIPELRAALRYSKGAIGTMAGFAATGFGALGAGSGLAAGAAGVSGTDPVTSPDSPRRARGIGG